MKAIDPVLRAILDAREARWLRRRELCGDGALLTLVMNVPGPQKNLPRWNEAHRAVTDALKKDMQERRCLLFFEKREAPAGSESHFVTDMPPVELKKYAVRLETEHPIGRLLDADVMDTQGEVVDRKFLGLPPRRCLCCDREVGMCVRGRHAPEELLRRAEELLDAWRDAR
ncbi:MAG: citrate lyase holo-[acyl-carrier protein] synthase [Synergistaceae bacterium]|jgi:holo-ACP synthase|nr:citrate lyase holo-[acyl-carrier protein] synthase [Synergistaceae bacterium]